MDDYYLSKMIELAADGIDFIPLSDALAKRDYLRCNIINSYTRAEWESGSKAIPKTPYLFWKLIDGKKVYCS